MGVSEQDCVSRNIRSFIYKMPEGALYPISVSVGKKYAYSVKIKDFLLGSVAKTEHITVTSHAEKGDGWIFYFDSLSKIVIAQRHLYC